MLALRLTLESFRFAWQALKSNLLRTTLSLLGVTVGIFAIIAVFTVVDSLESNIRQSMDFLGEKVIYVASGPGSSTPPSPGGSTSTVRYLPNVSFGLFSAT